MTAKTHINSFLLQITLVSMLCLKTQGNASAMEHLQKDINKERPCQASILSGFFEDVKASDTISTIDNDPRIQQLCPNLQYSCCQFGQMKKLALQIQESLSYLTFRNTFLKNLLQAVERIKEADFNDFLKKLTQEDIGCFDDAQNNFYNLKLQTFDSNEAIKKMLESRQGEQLFDSSRLLREFKELKGLIKLNLATIEHNREFREKYYTGVVCTMCSPQFTRQIEFSSEKSPLMEVNKMMCKHILQEKISTLNSLKSFNTIQKVIDLSFCARKNSQKNRDYSGVGMEDLGIVNVYMEMIPENIKKFHQCVVNEQNFFDQQSECKRVCQQSLDMVDIKMMSIEKIINAENEIRNIFARESEFTNSYHRIQSQIKSYRDTRQKYISNELLIYNETSRNENVFVIKTNGDPLVDFAKIDIVVTPHGGVNFLSKPMSFLAAKSVLLFYSFFVFFFSLFLF